MRLSYLAIPVLAAALGCGKGEMEFEGPTVNAFVGKLVQDGKPVNFEGETVSLQMFSDKGESFGVPLTPQGEFTIGKMPVGKYTVNLLRVRADAKAKGGAAPYSVPGGLTIAEGKTEYSVELGKGFKK